jgi:excisionase family DNA binding protein
VDRWVSTTQAAARLGVSLATVRALVRSGKLAGTAEQRDVRKRWRIDAASVDAYLARAGNGDDRGKTPGAGAAKRYEAASELTQQIAALMGELSQRPSAEQYAEARAETERQRTEVASLTAIVLDQRARSQAMEEAEQHQATACRHLSAAVEAQSQAAAALRRALQQADDALGELLIPGIGPRDRER